MYPQLFRNNNLHMYSSTTDWKSTVRSVNFQCILWMAHWCTVLMYNHVHVVCNMHASVKLHMYQLIYTVQVHLCKTKLTFNSVPNFTKELPAKEENIGKQEIVGSIIRIIEQTKLGHLHWLYAIAGHLTFHLTHKSYMYQSYTCTYMIHVPPFSTA